MTATERRSRGAYRYGFEYSIARRPIRLVVLTRSDADERGAVIRTRTVRAGRAIGLWRIVLEVRGRRASQAHACWSTPPAVWVGLSTTVVQQPPPPPASAVQGSHIVIRRLFDATTRLHIPDR